eukprot:GFKZ01001072.1.p1 GENE.GFKZ01001072.1~~GFKZ01001072.1.p1  ORF type:complete len:298 (-),score=32.63 GFKZ01001072.1:1989-2882(-)
MQALALVRRSAANQAVGRLLFPSHAYRNSPPLPYRRFCTDDHFKQFRGSASTLNAKQHEKTDEMLNEENVKDLSSEEIARLRIVYRLVKEHIDSSEGKKSSVDLDLNPLLDPRSFDIRRIPSLSPELLKHFRQDLPSEIAAGSRPLSTHGIWDGAQGSEKQAALNAEFEARQAAAAEQGRATDVNSAGSVQRQSFSPQSNVPYRSDPTLMGTRRKPKCPLKDERGRVHVDFRAVGSLAPFVSENGKILPKRRTFLSSKAQRRVARAVKTARQMAFISPKPNPAPTYEELVELARSLP